MENGPDLLALLLSSVGVLGLQALAITASLCAGDQIQGLMHTRQALYHLRYIPKPQVFTF